MKTRVDLDIFGRLAKARFGRLELLNKEIHSVAKEHDVSIPSIIWKQKIERGIYFAGVQLKEDLPIEQTLSDDELYDIRVENSPTNLYTTVTVKNKITGLSGLLTCYPSQDRIDNAIERLKDKHY